MTNLKKISFYKKITEAVIDGDSNKLKILLTQLKDSFDCIEALNEASKNGYDECVKLFISKSNIKINKSQALFLASINGHAECVKLLIPLHDPRDNNSHELRSSTQNNHNDCVELLLPYSDISARRLKDWKCISSDIKQVILSYFSKITLNYNLLSKDEIAKFRKNNKI